MKVSLRHGMIMVALTASLLTGLYACTAMHQQSATSLKAASSAGVAFPSDDLAYTNCATFAEQEYGGAFPFLTCENGQRAVLLFNKAAFERVEGRDMVTSIVDFRDAECSAISKGRIVQQQHVEVRDGMIVKTTFAGENGWIRYRAPRSINMIAFDYRPKARRVWDGVKYRLMVITVQDAVGKTAAKIELGVDSWGVGYTDVWGHEPTRENADVTGSGELQHLYRFDIPTLTGGEHVFAYGQRSLTGEHESAETFFALDGEIVFTSRSFFVPDMFEGFTGTIELPGDAEAIALQGLLSGEPACLKK